MTYNQFQTLCKEAWRTEGQGNSSICRVHECLLKAKKHPAQSPNDVIGIAWKVYKALYL